MARTIETVTRVSVTDDVTGMTYAGMSNDLGDWMDVQSYRVTVERLAEDGEVISTAFTRDLDMHDHTFDAITGFINGESDRNLFNLILSLWKIPLTTGDALWEFITGGIITNLLSILGGKPKSTANHNSTANKGETYVSHVRAYAIAQGWKNAAGKTVGEKGKMSNDVVITFQTKTGITPDKFDEGMRASIPVESTEDTSTEAESN